MTGVHIDYIDYPGDAGSLLADYEITRHDVSDAERRRVAAQLATVLRSDRPGTFEITLNGVTVHGQGADEASYFHQHFV